MKLDVGKQAAKGKIDVVHPNLIGYELDSERNALCTLSPFVHL